MTDDEHYHRRTHDDEMQVLLQGAEGASLSFCGREDFGTVTCYAVDPDTQQRLFALFECDAALFEVLLEQASGALMDARDGEGTTLQPSGPTGPTNEGAGR